MSKGVPKQFPGGWTVAVESPVSLVSIGPALGFEVWLSPELTIHIRIETEFTFIENESSEVMEVEAGELGRLAMLYGEEVTAINLTDDGQLTILIERGRRIKVSPHPRFESFEVTGPNTANGGWRFIGLPAGGLAVWTE